MSRELLEKLRLLVSGVDWLNGRQSRAAVFSEIRFKLNELPEEPYPEILWNAGRSSLAFRCSALRSVTRITRLLVTGDHSHQSTDIAPAGRLRVLS